jgi:autophagy-related protein 2
LTWPRCERVAKLFIQKFAALLKLPPVLAIVSARISSLRLTVPADLYNSGILVELNGIKVCVNANLDGQEPGQDVRPKVHKFRSEKLARASQKHKPSQHQFHLHDPGGARLPSEDDDQVPGPIPTPVDLAKSFLQTEYVESIEGDAGLQTSIIDPQDLGQSQMSSEDGDERPAVGIGNNLSLPSFLADFLKGVGDRIRLKVRKVELDIILKLDRPSESSSCSDASDRWEEVTFRLGVDSIQVDGATASELKGKGVDSKENPSFSTQYTRRITFSNIEAMVISEASVFSSLARSTAPSSPETTQASHLATFHSKTSLAAISRADSHEDLFPQSLETSNVRSRSEKLPVPESTEDRTEHSIIPQQVGDDYHYSMLADSMHSSGQGTQISEEPIGDSGIIPESSRYNDYASYMSRSQSSVESNHQYSRRRYNGQRNPPASFGDFDTASPPEDTTDVHHRLGLQERQVLSSHSATRTEIGKVSEPPYLGSDHSLPASENLAQSSIFTHEEASMYMSAISQTSATADEDTTLHRDWASSTSEDEGKDLTTHTSTEPAIVHESGLEPLYQAYRSESEPVRKDLPKHIRCNHKVSALQSARSSDIHSTDPATDIELENKPSATPARKGSAELPGSETSSTNLNSSFSIVKQIITVSTIVVIVSLSPSPLELPRKDYSQRHRKSDKNMPGGFEDVFESNTASISSISSESPRLLENPQEGKCWIEILNIQVLMDMGLTRMLILLSQQVNTSLSPRPPNPKIRTITSSRVSKYSEWQLTVKNVSWKFLDAVKGKPVSIARHVPAEQDAQSFSVDSEILLRASMENLTAINSRAPPLTSTTTISVGKLSFGYRSDNILCFNSDLKMRHSSRDVLSPVGKDVILNITRSGQSHKYELRTLPVHLTLDLRRLDETFSWFGGFSSMLGLGSSMMSTMTIVDAKSKTPRPSKPIRGAHFESRQSNRPTRAEMVRHPSKVTARIEGLVFDVKGTQSSLHFETTAMKLVTRSEGLGLQVDRLRFSGPYSKQTSSEPTITMKVTNLRIEYLPTPQEVDLTRLLELLSPSKEKDARDDDILLDRLFLQRKQGAVVRTSIEKLDGNITNLRDLRCFATLSEDFKKLSTVTKYLPEDDRAGVLILGSVKDLRLAITVNSNFGVARLTCKNMEGAHVTFPSLTTLSIKSVDLHRNDTEQLLGEALPVEVASNSQLPAVMVRFVGNAMEPTAKIKFHCLRIEYHVSTAIAIMGLEESAVTELMVAEMVNSVATLTSRQNINASPPKLSKQNSESSDKSMPTSKMLRFDISFTDSIIGLNPRKSLARGLIILTDTQFLGAMPSDKESSAVLEVRKASIMVVDNVENITPTIGKAVAQKALHTHTQVESFLDIGYVSVGTISAAKATIRVIELEAEPNKAIEIDIRDDLFVLETCADSTQTIQSILSGLSPPKPPSTELKYRTEVIPIEDMLASFTGDVFATTRTNLEVDESSLRLDEGDMMDDEVPQSLEFVTSFYNPEPDVMYDEIANSMLEDDLDSLASPSMIREIGDKNILESFEDQAEVAPGNEPLDFQEGHFGLSSAVTVPDTKGLSGNNTLRTSPLRVRVRDVHFIWNLFDGYDWQHTRDTISKAVDAVQTKAIERASRNDKRKSLDPEEEEESVIGDFLFNSIYIGIPSNRDPRELTRQVNRNLDDLVSEPESNATSTASGSPSRQGHVPRPYSRKLRLKRSQNHKMTFELKGISADVVVSPPNSGEIQSSIDVRIQDLEIFDHVPTSTWKKFTTYMHDAGERESGTSMIHIEILNVKPVPDLAASEIVMKVSPRLLFIYKANR